MPTLDIKELLTKPEYSTSCLPHPQAPDLFLSCTREKITYTVKRIGEAENEVIKVTA